jgi:hypothetical protein
MLNNMEINMKQIYETILYFKPQEANTSALNF